MSLPEAPAQRSLFDVANLLGDCFAPADRFRLFAETVYPLLLAARPALEKAYCANNGRPAEEPVVLLGASILQFTERAPDRRAAECVKYHLGWKMALQLDLSLDAFHPTTLHTFRERLLANGQAKLAFDAVLDGLREAGLVPRRGRQRLDSTHVLGLVSKMSGLECVRESLRLALQEVARRDDLPPGALPASWPLLWERYVENTLDYRADEATLAQKLAQAGADARCLLGWVEALAPAPHAASAGPQVLLLRRVFGENFEVGPGADPATTAAEPAPQPAAAPAAPAAAPVPATTAPATAATAAAAAAAAVTPRRAQPAEAVKNPHDPDARWCRKGDAGSNSKNGKEWVGYKVQVAETVEDEDGPPEDGEPTRSFITSIVTQEATGSDEAGMRRTLSEQADSGLGLPTELYVDGAYVSAEQLKEAREQGRELLGPAQPAPNKGPGFKSEAFDVDVEKRVAVCPAGHASVNCSRLEEAATGRVSYRFEWGRKQCAACPLAKQCVGKNQDRRTLAVGEHHAHLQARRREQQTGEFKRRMRRRNAIEGTHSELVRGHGMRRARYRGLERVRLQNYLIGAACNAKRWIGRAIWDAKRAVAQALGGAARAAATVTSG